MGQQEVHDFLKKNGGEWFTSREIAEELKKSTSSVSENLRRLRKSNQIFFIKNPYRRYGYRYMFK